MLVDRQSLPDERCRDATMAFKPMLSSLMQLASTSARMLKALGQDSDDSASRPAKTKEQLWRHYVRVLHKVVEESDVVLLVLDAQDPEGCRSQLVEEEVQWHESEEKKLVFILNKISAHASNQVKVRALCYQKKAVKQSLSGRKSQKETGV
ncbi:hypothetical protein K488DRAFT_55132 [Vararia minispora EC-137]|uniref:Uncharacterized protein n=1 Tax=Vararia minispora EC-137 TaxID=1314806 RepID=A0ACB8QEF7_9AGAM|nr:hypothetical protein K488DRAFT_55132 [Vararia minispora EC-137]